MFAMSNYRRFYSKCNLFPILTEPDVGMPEKEAHRFFQQLIAGVVSVSFVII